MAIIQDVRREGGRVMSIERARVVCILTVLALFVVVVLFRMLGAV